MIEVTNIWNEVNQQYVNHPYDLYMNLHDYTNHVICGSTRISMLSIQCTYHFVYIQFTCAIPFIQLDKDTTLYYLDNKLYLSSNRIIIATSIIKNGTISWSDTITFDNICFMNLPTLNILPNNEDILPSIILSNFE